VPARLTQLTSEGLQFLHERHLATFSSRHADGTPHVTPIGFTWDADHHIAWVITSGHSRKARNATRGDPVAICQVDGRRWITLIGTPRVSTDPDEIVAAVARYTDRYRPPRPNPTRIAIAVSITGLLGSPTLVAHQAHA
jgi:F420H(2)-dependent biliverdin reductase